MTNNKYHTFFLLVKQNLMDSFTKSMYIFFSIFFIHVQSEMYKLLNMGLTFG
jgi:hypothetical protein